MTTPENEQPVPPQTVAPVVERTSAAAQAAQAAVAQVAAPAPAPQEPVTTVLGSLPPPDAPAGSVAVSGGADAPGQWVPASTVPFPGTGLESGTVNSLDISQIPPELMASLMSGAGSTTLPPTGVLPSEMLDSRTTASAPDVDVKVLSGQPGMAAVAESTVAQPQPEAAAEPPADPMTDVDSVDVVNQIPMIDAGTNPRVHQEFIIEKKGTRGGPEKLTTPNVQQVVFPDLLASSMMNNLEHPAAARQDDEASRRWAAILQASTGVIPSQEMFQDIPNRPEGEFRQYLQTERNKVGFSAPTFNDVAGAKLTGERAIQRVRALMGQGGLVMVPLWHSGFHVTLKTPSESALIEVRRRMENERISLGRYTFGMAFSNTASYTVDIMMGMILEHVYETSLKDQSDLRTKIEALDIPVLMWGMACAVWPNGFQYARALSTEQGILKNQVITALIDVGKLMWVDNKAFSAKQKAHMSNRQTGTMTPEQVQAYKDDFPLRAGRLVPLAEGISVEFAPPSIEAYIASGRRWIEKLVQIVEGTITNDREDIEGRNRAIIQHGNATYMRQLGHWVKQITLGGDVVDDQENIEAVLETLSEREDIRIAYVEGYRKYVNDITTAIIGIPEAAPNDLSVPRFPNLIPIDVISTFFTLLMQRVNQLINR
jgi:hypothetical protein